MDSNNIIVDWFSSSKPQVEMEQSTPEPEKSMSELKYVGFVRNIVIKLLILLLKVYTSVKQLPVFKFLESVIASVENFIVYVMGPIFEKLKDWFDRVLMFFDNQFEKYAPTHLKKLLVRIQSVIKKIISIIEQLLTRGVTLLAAAIQYLIRKGLPTTKSIIQPASLVGTTQSLLQKGLNTTQSLVQSATLVGTAQSLLQKGLDTTKSIIGDANKVTESLITNPVDLAGQVLDATNSLVKDSPILGSVNSVAQNLVKEAQAGGLKTAFRSAYTSIKLVILPVIAQFWYRVNTYPLLHAIAQLILPVAESFSELYNKLVSYMNGKGCSLFSYFPLVPINEMEAAYKVVKTAMDGLAAAEGILGLGSDN